MQTLIASIWLVVNPVQENTLALHYKPCMALYEAAKKSGLPQDMHNVVALCTTKVFSEEL